MRVDIRLLGGFEVHVDGARLPDHAWTRQAPAALVKLLALSPGHRLRREQVIDALWPDLLVDQAAPRLHKAAHYGRTALGTGDGLVLGGDVVSLFPGAEVVVDVDLFDASVESARSGSAAAAVEAVELYRGELLPGDVYESWTEQARDRLRLAYVEMLHLLGRWDAIVADDRLDEVAHLQLVRGHLARGDRRAALRQLDTMEATWQQDLGEGPGDEALSLRQDALDLPLDLAGGGRALHTPIPPPPTPTVGRDQEIDAVSGLLEEARAVTLLGPGGVGKTRLATEVGLRRAAATGVDSCFVDLTKVAEASLVSGLVARELGIRVESAHEVEQLLEEALRGRALLLVLDNFEHVLDAADLVRRLVDSSPDIRVLATSRARLRVAGERVFDVHPLSIGSESAPDDPADALTLFDQAAAAVDPSFHLADHREDVLDICRAVDGLPLAIELAAGHVRTLPPQLLRTRLGARLASGSAAVRGTPPRQRTVAATIDWSLQLLGQEERALFVRLGVFAADAPLEAVEQVCGDPGEDVVESLSRLVDHSLVRRVGGPFGEPRFVLLELLRERARELLAEDEAVCDEMGRRHAAYVAGFLDDLDESRWSVDAARWIELITGLLGEIRLAHARAHALGEVALEARIAAGMGTYWHREGHHPEGRRWFAQSWERSDALDDHLVARLRLGAGFVEWTRDSARAREHWAESGRRFRASGHDRYLSYSLALESGTYIGDPANQELAMMVCEEAIDVARRVGERPLLAQALNIQGELARVGGDDERAEAAYREGLELATAAHDQVHASMFLGNLSFIADHRGEYDEAARLCRDALRLSWPLGRRLVAAMTLLEMVGPEIGLGHPERAAVLLGAGDEAMRRLGVDLHPGDRPEHDRVEAALRSALGDETLRPLLREGSGLPLDEAVAMALAEG